MTLSIESQASINDSLLPRALHCTVEGLEYFISDDNLHNTFAKLYLRMAEENTDFAGTAFSVDLPPSHLGHADFVVSEERFFESMESAFKIGHRCKVGLLAKKPSFVRMKA